MDTNDTSQKSGVFVKARDKYSDMKSSAYCLVIAGIVGLLIVLLDYLNILPFKLNANNSILFYFAMITLFVIFLITGIYTFRSAKKVKDSISDEESQTEKIISWVKDNLTAEFIDEKCSESEDMDFDNSPDEAKYLSRFDIISMLIADNFEISDEAYLNSIVEEVYPELFD